MTNLATSYKPASVVSDSFILAKVMIFTTQPSTTSPGATMSPVVVTVRDGGGSTITTFTGNITLAILNNPSGGVLSGTTTVAAVAGVATFGALSINLDGTGYTFQATSSGIPNVTSTAFTITNTSFVFTAVVMPSLTEIAAFPFDAPPNGDIQPSTFSGFVIQSFGTSSAPVETFMSWDLITSPWTGITINGVTLLKADAVGSSPYVWSGQAVLTAPGVYPATIF